MEEDVYKLNTLLSCTSPEDVAVRLDSVNNGVSVSASGDELHLASNFLQLEPGSDFSGRVIKSQIANHPLYPDLLSAYIECQKVGATAEVASLLQEISRESHTIGARREIENDPELDEFMESYCNVLHRYKEELSKPFNEATLFLCSIESQLNNLCKGTPTIPLDNNRSDEAAETSEDELINCEKVEAVQNRDAFGTRVGDRELKEMLLRKYNGYLSSLRKEFMKKRKKGKLPKDARMALMDWWNSHYRWPYPTEDEKLMLSEMTGLDQKQINNWFINQRKRHWKPSTDMRFRIMDGISGAGSILGAPM